MGKHVCSISHDKYALPQWSLTIIYVKTNMRAINNKYQLCFWSNNVSKVYFCKANFKVTQLNFDRISILASYGVLLPKFFWPTVRKNCSGDQEKLLKFEAGVREFANILRSLEQFIQTGKCQNNFW